MSDLYAARTVNPRCDEMKFPEAALLLLYYIAAYIAQLTRSRSSGYLEDRRKRDRFISTRNGGIANSFRSYRTFRGRKINKGILQKRCPYIDSRDRKSHVAMQETLAFLAAKVDINDITHVRVR